LIAVSSAASCNVLRSGCAGAIVRPEYGPFDDTIKPLTTAGAAGALRKYVDVLQRPETFPTSSASDKHPYQGLTALLLGQKAEAAQAIGRSRGGHQARFHALPMPGKPIAFVLTPGNVRQTSPSPPRCSTTSRHLAACCG